jgi:hypothetical protein
VKRNLHRARKFDNIVRAAPNGGVVKLPRAVADMISPTRTIAAMLGMVETATG